MHRLSEIPSATVKIGMDTRCPPEKTGTTWVMRGTARELQEDVDFALQTLGVDYIDVIILCRVPHDVPIEESVKGNSKTLF